MNDGNSHKHEACIIVFGSLESLQFECPKQPRPCPKQPRVPNSPAYPYIPGPLQYILNDWYLTSSDSLLAQALARSSVFLYFQENSVYIYHQTVHITSIPSPVQQRIMKQSLVVQNDITVLLVKRDDIFIYGNRTQMISHCVRFS